LKVQSSSPAVKMYTTHEHWLICPMHVLWKFNSRPCEKPECLRCTLIGKRPPQVWRYTGLLKRAARHVDQFVSPSRFTAGMHAERCGPAGEAMLRATSRPRPEVMLGYWAPVLAPPPTAANAIADAIANLRAQHTPYTLVLGEEPDSQTRTWMAQHFPEATVIALPGSGHFPHVVHPDAFARIVASF